MDGAISPKNGLVEDITNLILEELVWLRKDMKEEVRNLGDRLVQVLGGKLELDKDKSYIGLDLTNSCDDSLYDKEYETEEDEHASIVNFLHDTNNNKSEVYKETCLFNTTDLCDSINEGEQETLYPPEPIFQIDVSVELPEPPVESAPANKNSPLSAISSSPECANSDRLAIINSDMAMVTATSNDTSKCHLQNPVNANVDLEETELRNDELERPVSTNGFSEPSTSHGMCESSITTCKESTPPVFAELRPVVADIFYGSEIEEIEPINVKHHQSINEASEKDYPVSTCYLPQMDTAIPFKLPDYDSSSLSSLDNNNTSVTAYSNSQSSAVANSELSHLPYYCNSHEDSDVNEGQSSQPTETSFPATNSSHNDDVFDASQSTNNQLDYQQLQQQKSICENKLINVGNLRKSSVYQCSICNRLFSQQTCLARHVRTHSREHAPYKCHKCGKSFRQNAQLNSHLTTHSSDKLYKCPVCCEASFSRRIYLKRHMAAHDEAGGSSEEAMECSVCENIFPTKESLTVHMQGHSRRHSCTICHKIFSTSRRLQAHMVLHPDHKAFCCPKCDKQFHSEKQLLVHKRKHKLKKPFKCVICKESFEHSRSLSDHVARLHSYRSLTRCKICKKSFCNARLFDTHVKKHNLKSKNPSKKNNLKIKAL